MNTQPQANQVPSPTPSPTPSPQAQPPQTPPSPTPSPTPETPTQSPTQSPTQPISGDPFAAAIAALPEAQREHVSKAGYKSIEDLINSDMSLQTMLGGDRSRLARVPEKSRAEDPQGWAEYDKVSGVPTSPEGYGDYKPATGNAMVTSDQLRAFDEKILSAGATPAARQAALDAFHELSMQEAQAADAATAADHKEWDDKLKAEWGAAYPQKIAAAEAARHHIDPDGELHKMMTDMGFEKHGLYQRALARIADMVAEGGTMPNGEIPANGGGAMTPAAAMSALSEFEARNNAALMDAANPDHKRIVQERDRLMALAYPAT